jgi:hypothetical protein
VTSKAAKRARRAAAPEQRKPSRKQLVAVVVASGCLLLTGVALVVRGGVMFAGATGLVGTPGRLYVDRCAVVRESNHPVTWCGGILRDTAGRLVDTNASIAVSARVGSTIAVRDIPGTGLETVGFRAVEGWATLLFVGLLCLELGLIPVWALRRRRVTPPRPTARVRVLLLLAPGAAAAVGAAGYALIVAAQAIAGS